MGTSFGCFAPSRRSGSSSRLQSRHPRIKRLCPRRWLADMDAAREAAAHDRLWLTAGYPSPPQNQRSNFFSTRGTCTALHTPSPRGRNALLGNAYSTSYQFGTAAGQGPAEGGAVSGVRETTTLRAGYARRWSLGTI